MKFDFSFLQSNRFWVMVIGCVTIAAEGNFTLEANLKAVSAFCAGFIVVRTADRAAEKILQ